MPNVPNVPGVPKLSGYSAATFVLLVADQIGLLAQLLVPRWGIYLNGFPVIHPDSVTSFELKQDYSLSDYPVERGGFQSYNKVQLPTDINMRVACGGSEFRRQFFLAEIEQQMDTTLLYDIVTPEKVYLGYNFSHRDFKRTATNGVGLIIVDLWFKEIRQTARETYTNTQQPGSAGTQAAGNVQPESVPASVSNRIGTVQ